MQDSQQGCTEKCHGHLKKSLESIKTCNHNYPIMYNPSPFVCERVIMGLDLGQDQFLQMFYSFVPKSIFADYYE